MPEMNDNDPPKPGSNNRQDTATFSFRFGSLGPEDPAGEEPGSPAGTAASTDPTGATTREHSFGLEIKDGVLRIGSGEGAFEYPLISGEAGPPEHDPFPLLTTIGTWFRRLVTAVAVLIPVCLLLVGVFTDQTTETVFYMTLFGVIVAVMLVSAVRPKRTLFGEVIGSLLTDMARKEMTKQRPAPEPPREPADTDDKPA